MNKVLSLVNIFQEEDPIFDKLPVNSNLLELMAWFYELTKITT